MGYLMDVDDHDNVTFIKHGHKKCKIIDKKKYKRINKIKKKSKSKNHRRN